MVRSCMATVAWVLLSVLLAPAMAAEAWRPIFTTSGSDGTKSTPTIDVGNPDWRVSYAVLRKERADWSYFKITVKDRAKSEVIKVITVTNTEIPKRSRPSLSGMDMPGLDEVRGTSDDEISKATYIDRATMQGQGMYFLEVYASGVTWTVRVEVAGGAAPVAPSTGGDTTLLREGDVERADSLESSWTTVESVSTDNLLRNKQFTVEQTDWRIEYLVQPKSANPPPSIIIAIKEVDTGKVHLVAALPASRLSDTAASRDSRSGIVYLHQPGKYEFDIKWNNVDWSASVQVPGEGKAVGAAPPAGGAGAAGWDDAGWDNTGGTTGGADWPMDNDKNTGKGNEDTKGGNQGPDDKKNADEGLKGWDN